MAVVLGAHAGTGDGAGCSAATAVHRASTVEGTRTLPSRRTTRPTRLGAPVRRTHRPATTAVVHVAVKVHATRATAAIGGCRGRIADSASGSAKAPAGRALSASVALVRHHMRTPTIKHHGHATRRVIRLIPALTRPHPIAPLDAAQTTLGRVTRVPHRPAVRSSGVPASRRAVLEQAHPRRGRAHRPAIRRHSRIPP